MYVSYFSVRLGKKRNCALILYSRRSSQTLLVICRNGTVELFFAKSWPGLGSVMEHQEAEWVAMEGKTIFIEVQLIYNIILASGVQHNDSVFLQIIFHQKLLQDNGYKFPMLYNTSLLLTYFICSSLYLLIPYLYFAPPPLSPLGSTNLFAL